MKYGCLSPEQFIKHLNIKISGVNKSKNIDGDGRVRLPNNVYSRISDFRLTSPYI